MKTKSGIYLRVGKLIRAFITTFLRNANPVLIIRDKSKKKQVLNFDSIS
jgi:hypothetical protein